METKIKLLNLIRIKHIYFSNYFNSYHNLFAIKYLRTNHFNLFMGLNGCNAFHSTIKLTEINDYLVVRLM